MESLYIMKDKSELNSILHLVQLLASETGAPLDTLLLEIASPNSIIQIRKNEVRVLGYICGYFVSPTEFYVCQMFALDDARGSTREISHLEVYQKFEDHIRELGARRVYGYTKLDPKRLEKFGYKIERYVLSKTLKED